MPVYPMGNAIGMCDSCGEYAFFEVLAMAPTRHYEEHGMMITPIGVATWSDHYSRTTGHSPPYAKCLSCKKRMNNWEDSLLKIKEAEVDKIQTFIQGKMPEDYVRRQGEIRERLDELDEEIDDLKVEIARTSPAIPVAFIVISLLGGIVIAVAGGGILILLGIVLALVGIGIGAYIFISPRLPLVDLKEEHEKLVEELNEPVNVFDYDAREVYEYLDN